MPYTNLASGTDIGSLLRLIQEERASQALAGRPGVEVAAPMRQMITPPPIGPEDVGTSRMVGIKPEAAVGPTATPVVPTGATPARTTVGPTAIGGLPVTQAMPGGERLPSVFQSINQSSGQPGRAGPGPSPQPAPGPAPQRATQAPAPAKQAQPVGKSISATMGVSQPSLGTSLQTSATSLAKALGTLAYSAYMQLENQKQATLKNIAALTKQEQAQANKVNQYNTAGNMGNVSNLFSGSKGYGTSYPVSQPKAPSIGQKLVSSVSSLVKRLFG